jgi:hypothetical protein
MLRFEDKIKYPLNAKLTIDEVTRSVNMWINIDPFKLRNYLNANPNITLNAHGELTLKKKLNEKDTGKNTRRSPRSSLK